MSYKTAFLPVFRADVHTHTIVQQKRRLKVRFSISSKPFFYVDVHPHQFSMLSSELPALPQ